VKISALNQLQKYLRDRNKEVGATQFFLGIPQFHFHFSRVDFLLCEDDTALQNSTADPQTRLHLLRMFKVPYCTKFGQFIVGKIIKIVATRCHILRLKCTKFDFGWALPQTPLRLFTVLPSWI